MSDIAEAVRRQVAEDSPRDRKVYLEAADTIASLTKRAEDAEWELDRIKALYKASHDFAEDLYQEVRKRAESAEASNALLREALTSVAIINDGASFVGEWYCAVCGSRANAKDAVQHTQSALANLSKQEPTDAGGER